MEEEMTMLLVVHVAGASIGLLAGMTAMFSRKGGQLHRRSGKVFVVSMLAMCVAAIVIATVRAQPINLVAGTLTAYLVATAMMTVRPVSDPARRLARSLMAAAFCAGIAAVALGLRQDDGVRVPLFMFGVLGVLGSIGDFKALRAGTLAGAPRLTRHLWRMSLALLIATASFFLGPRGRVRAVLPDALVTTPVLVLPVLLVLAAMFIWLWRVKKPAKIASVVLRRNSGFGLTRRLAVRSRLVGLHGDYRLEQDSR
jgi:uncharacterized membrane protein